MSKNIITAESVAREKLVSEAVKRIGVRQGSKLHKDIIDDFNKVKPDGSPMTYSAPWCAAGASAFAIRAYGIENAKHYFPLSYNCNTMIDKAKKMGIWHEKDSYRPKPADLILYDWDDKTGPHGEDKNSADHVGIVRRVDGSEIHVVECNKGTTESVGERKVLINGWYIRGFIAPKYDRITIQGRLIREADEMAKKAIKDKMIYDGSATHNTYNKAKKTDKRVNCATLASYILQAVKVLPYNRRIWLSDQINGSGATTLRKKSTVSHPRKTPGALLREGKLKPGDICGWKWSGGVHTAIVHHIEGKRIYWFTGGASDFRARKLIRRRPFYYHLKAGVVIHLHQPK